MSLTAPVDSMLIQDQSLVPLPTSSIPSVNVASVPQRSPLRYPGGKTWLIPHIRAWLTALKPGPELLVEPFAGGAIVSLTAVMEELAARCLMAEIDSDVAAFWHAAIQHGPELAERMRGFTPTRETVSALEAMPPRNVIEHGFRTLVLNRTRRGGILAPGASLTRKGENGNGITSRWYPQTLQKRLAAITAHADRISFHETDGMQLLESLLAEGRSRDDYAVFLDPPYTSAGGKRAGTRLYTHTSINHARLFEMLADSQAHFLMTYDRSPEVVALIQRHRFCAVEVVMKNGHHARLPELIITPQPVFPPKP